MSTPRNIREDKTNKIDRKAGDPADQQDRISYGEITKVIAKNSQVYVKVYGEQDTFLLADNTHPEGKPVPIVQPLNFINSTYGSLHKGMKVRIFWTGKNDAKFALVEIIGNEDFDLKGIYNKEPESNRQDTLPYLSISGGVII